MNTNTIEWRPIVGYEEIYEVSEHGDVRRIVAKKHGKRAINELWSFHEMPRGYLRLELTDANGKPKKWLKHVLVAYAFLGERPQGYEINHIDGDKSNCHYSNLEYVTPSENAKHAFRLGLKVPRRGELNGMAKLTDEMVLEIRIRYNNGEHQIPLSREYGISQAVVSNVIRMQSWCDATEADLIAPYKGAERRNAKLTDDIVRGCRIRAANNESIADLAREYGVDYKTMKSAVEGKRWKHVE